MLSAKKGVYTDGHKRYDVVESRKLFLHNAPTKEAIKVLPQDLDTLPNDRCSKMVVFIHDESTFTSNEDQSTQWGLKGKKMIKLRSKGAGIIIRTNSHNNNIKGVRFINKINGFLVLSDEEYLAAIATKPNILPCAWVFLEYSESHERYWTRDTFIAQMHRAIEIAKFKYPKEDGWCQVWVF